jgi:hypothetical protein
MAGYLPGSGALAFSTINSVFDGRGLNLNAYRGTQWYTAGGGSGTFSSGAISFNEFYNKGPSPAITISLEGFYSISGTVYSGPGPAYAEITLYSNGVAGWAGSDGSGSFTNWATPTTGGVGSSYWVRFTQTSSVSGTNETGSARNTWVALSGSPYFGVQRTLGGYGSRTYTIQIASDSGGSNIVATVTSIEIAAEIAF